MKNIIILLIILFNSINILYAQEYQSFLSDAGFQLNGSTHIPNDVLIKATQDENGFTTIIIEKNSSEQVKFLLKPFTFSLFETKLKNSFLEILQKNSLIDSYKDDDDNKKKSIELYSKIASYFYTINERPQIATVTLKENINIYGDIEYEKLAKKNLLRKILKRSETAKANASTIVGELENPIVEISFYSGFIEKIEVRGSIKGKDITFANKFSIGVSSLQNIKSFDNVRLYSLYEYDVNLSDSVRITTPVIPIPSNIIKKVSKGIEYSLTILPKDKVTKGNSNKFILNQDNSGHLSLYLNDVINYQRIIDVNANDISPDKQKIVLDINQETAKLFREESTKILEAVIYSDLIGALEEESPNGIIQTEISKKFNIKTHRRDFFNGGFGYFEYLDAKILLSKIEKDNKYLLPEENEFDLLSLYQHRNFSIGGSLNFFTFENQDLKLNVFLESGIEFSRSAYKFTEESQESNVNSIEWTTELKIHLFPEKRYGILFSDKLSYFEVLSEESDFVDILNIKKSWLNTFELEAYLDISTSAKLFVKYGLTHDFENINHNFSKLQLGGAFYILQKNRKDK